jgi:hypothetical protein
MIHPDSNISILQLPAARDYESELTLLSHLRAYVLESWDFIPPHFVDSFLNAVDDVEDLRTRLEERRAA